MHRPSESSRCCSSVRRLGRAYLQAEHNGDYGLLSITTMSTSTCGRVRRSGSTSPATVTVPSTCRTPRPGSTSILARLPGRSFESDPDDKPASGGLRRPVAIGGRSPPAQSAHPPRLRLRETSREPPVCGHRRASACRLRQAPRQHRTLSWRVPRLRRFDPPLAAASCLSSSRASGEGTGQDGPGRKGGSI